MSSFKTVINNLVTLLEDNEPLKTFCITAFGRPLRVKKIFKKRQEITNFSELPLIMITRPSVEKAYRTGVRDGQHTVRLYCIFHEEDKDKGLDELVEFEEYIDNALLSAPSEQLGAISIDPKASDSDEGEWWPVYAIVMDVEIQHRRM